MPFNLPPLPPNMSQTQFARIKARNPALELGHLLRIGGGPAAPPYRRLFWPISVMSVFFLQPFRQLNR